MNGDNRVYQFRSPRFTGKHVIIAATAIIVGVLSELGYNFWRFALIMPSRLPRHDEQARALSFQRFFAFFMPWMTLPGIDPI